MITALTLHNFKCYPDARIPLGQITLLTGLNSAGKSSVIHALLLLGQSFQAGLLQQGQLMINGPLVELGTAGDLFSDNPSEPQTLGLGLEWDTHAAATWAFQYTGPEDPLLGSSADPTHSWAKFPPFGGALHFLSAERVGPRTLYGLSPAQGGRVISLGQQGEFAAHFLAMRGSHPIPLRGMARGDVGENDAELKLLTQVERWLGVISPGVRLEGKILTDIDSVRVRFGFETAFGVDPNRRPANVGFGLSYVLPIVVLLLSVPRGTLVVIENPEAHLHPQGQSAMGRLLARAAAQGIQLIVETHSDHILNGLRLSVAGDSPTLAPEAVHLHYFERRERFGQVEHVLQSPKVDRRGRLDCWPEGFFDTWEKDLDDLLEF